MTAVWGNRYALGDRVKTCRCDLETAFRRLLGAARYQDEADDAALAETAAEVGDIVRELREVETFLRGYSHLSAVPEVPETLARLGEEPAAELAAGSNRACRETGGGEAGG
jgi:hypothetical protein